MMLSVVVIMMIVLIRGAHRSSGTVCSHPIKKVNTIQEILRDEISHGRIGWAYLAHLSERGSLDYVGPYLPMLLDAAIEDELFDTPDPEDPDAATIALGTLPKVKRAALFQEAIEDLVLPALRRFGVDIRSGEEWIKTKKGG